MIYGLWACVVVMGFCGFVFFMLSIFDKKDRGQNVAKGIFGLVMGSLLFSLTMQMTKIERETKEIEQEIKALKEKSEAMH